MNKTLITLSGLSPWDIRELRAHPKLQNSIHVKVHANHPDVAGLRVRTMDSALCEATITIISSVGLNFLSSWIYDKYKQNRIKKPMINGIEVDIENITPEEILAIFAKDKHIDPREDDTE